MSGALGYDDTLGEDATYDEAYEHFTKKLGLSDEEAKERLKALGYIPGEKDLVRLVENPKKYMNDYIESVLVKKTDDKDVLTKDEDKSELNPLIKKQVDSLKKSLKSNNISIDKIINHLKSE
jgi:outer membrane protein OmpA-like peptidoglycan-associated protein